MSSLLAIEPQVKVELACGRVTVDGHDVGLTELQWGLVCALARCRHAVAREQLEAMLWPDAAPEQTQNLLSVGLHRLRRRLGDRFVLATAEGYRLGGQVDIDLWEIESYAENIRTLRTDGASAKHWLATFQRIACTCSRSNARYEFVRALERRLATASAAVNEHFYADAFRRGDVAIAHELAQLSLRVDPCDEAAREVAIRCQLVLGNRAAAIREYTDYTRTLAEELDLEPSFSIRALIESTPMRPVLVR